jgi:hypothetical protein
MNRRLLILIPLLAVATSITILEFSQPSASPKQCLIVCAVDSQATLSSSLTTVTIPGWQNRLNP